MNQNELWEEEKYEALNGLETTQTHEEEEEEEEIEEKTP